MKVRVVGLGAGGHAKGLIEILLDAKTYTVVGMLTQDASTWRNDYLGVKILGGDDLLPGLIADGVLKFFNGIGGADNVEARRAVYVMARGLGMAPIGLVHRAASVSHWAHLGPGAEILAGSYVGPEVQTGENVLINTGAIVEHDCRIGDHAHIAIGARVAGACVVGVGAMIGAGATILPGVTIGEWAIVGAGAVVLHDVPSRTVVVGVPAGERRRVKDE